VNGTSVRESACPAVISQGPIEIAGKQGHGNDVAAGQMADGEKR
jgi:hypothetical protein